jgi:hypothetical protein
LLPRADIGIGGELEDSIRTLVSTVIVMRRPTVRSWI